MRHSGMKVGVRLTTMGVAVAALALAGCSKKSTADDAAAAAASSSGTNDATAAAAAPAAAAPAADNTDTLSGAKLASFTGDAAKGKEVFVTCTTCHSIDAGVNKIGPSLHDVVGRKAGQIPGFVYSTANKSSGITWTPEKLFQYLEAPQRVVPGTKMTFAGFPNDPQKRADVIAYLKAN